MIIMVIPLSIHPDHTNKVIARQTLYMTGFPHVHTKAKSRVLQPNQEASSVGGITPLKWDEEPRHLFLSQRANQVIQCFPNHSATTHATVCAAKRAAKSICHMIAILAGRRSFNSGDSTKLAHSPQPAAGSRQPAASSQQATASTYLPTDVCTVSPLSGTQCPLQNAHCSVPLSTNRCTMTADCWLLSAAC